MNEATVRPRASKSPALLNRLRLNADGSRWRWATAAAILVVVIVAPLFMNGYQVSILALAVCYMVATIGFNMSLGWAGLLIFTGSAFFGFGAFVGGRMAVLGLPTELVIVIAGLAGGVLGLAYGALTVKLNHYYFAITGIALMFLLDFFYRTFPAITGGYGGFSIPMPKLLVLGNTPLASGSSYYYFGVVLVVIAFVAARRIERSPLGRSWRAVRSNPGVASGLGVDVWRSKLYAFTITSVYLSVAGSWYGYLSLRFLPETYLFNELIFMFLILIVGGLGSTSGMVLGSLLLVLLREYLRGFPGMSEIIYGVVLLLAVLFFSKGIYGAITARIRALREQVL